MPGASYSSLALPGEAPLLGFVAGSVASCFWWLAINGCQSIDRLAVQFSTATGAILSSTTVHVVPVPYIVVGRFPTALYWYKYRYLDTF